MAKYSMYAKEDILLAIGNEIAESNRLKRLELEMKLEELRFANKINGEEPIYSKEEANAMEKEFEDRV